MLEKKGYVTANDFKDAEMEKAYVQLQNDTGQSLEQTDLEKKKYANFEAKALQNRDKLSFAEQLATKTKIKSLKQGFKQGCDNAHPSYANGYIPRHFNYLKSSANLSGNYKRQETP